MNLTLSISVLVLSSLKIFSYLSFLIKSSFLKWSLKLFFYEVNWLKYQQYFATFLMLCTIKSKFIHAKAIVPCNLFERWNDSNYHLKVHCLKMFTVVFQRREELSLFIIQNKQDVNDTAGSGHKCCFIPLNIRPIWVGFRIFC